MNDPLFNKRYYLNKINKNSKDGGAQMSDVAFEYEIVQYLRMGLLER